MEIIVFLLIVIGLLLLAALILLILNTVGSYNSIKMSAGLILGVLLTLVALWICSEFINLQYEPDIFLTVLASGIGYCLLTYYGAERKKRQIPLPLAEDELEAAEGQEETEQENKIQVSKATQLFLQLVTALLLLDVFIALTSMFGQFGLPFLSIRLLHLLIAISAVFLIQKKSKIAWQLLTILCMWTVAGFVEYCIRTLFISHYNWSLMPLFHFWMLLRLGLAIYIFFRLQREETLAYFHLKINERSNELMRVAAAVLFLIVLGNL